LTGLLRGASEVIASAADPPAPAIPGAVFVARGCRAKPLSKARTMSSNPDLPTTDPASSSPAMTGVPSRRNLRRLALLSGMAMLVGGIAAPTPGLAQGGDPAALALIRQLQPRPGGTRGIRVPGGEAATPATAAASAAPVASSGSGINFDVPRPAGFASPAPAAAAPPPPPVRQAALARPAPAPRATTAPEGAPAVSITVTFLSGSAVLTPEAEHALESLGRALASEDLRPYRFRIEGHTDTVGDPAQNQALSERRAQAVKEHLAMVYGVDAGRLTAVGYGAAQPLVPTPAQVPEPRNRRVQVVNLGS
jgi:outer membrane protein OmpA-like peptidoglycan-associated protein